MTVQLRTLSSVAAVAVLVVAAGGAVAGPVFTQSSDLQSGRASDFDFGAGFETAENFVLVNSATVTSLEWFGGYDFGSSQPTPFDDFTIRFYADHSGSPAQDPFAEFHVGNVVNRVDTGRDYNFGSDEFLYSANIPDTSLDGGTKYYLSIVADTAGFSTDWFWGTSSVGDKEEWARDLRPPATWTLRGLDHAFTLNGTSVPEPSTLALLTLGCCTLFGYGLRRRRKQCMSSHGRAHASL